MDMAYQSLQLARVFKSVMGCIFLTWNVFNKSLLCKTFLWYGIHAHFLMNSNVSTNPQKHSSMYSNPTPGTMFIAWRSTTLSNWRELCAHRTGFSNFVWNSRSLATPCCKGNHVTDLPLTLNILFYSIVVIFTMSSVVSCIPVQSI